MARRLPEGSEEIKAAIRQLGVDPNNVRNLRLDIGMGRPPVVHVELYPDHQVAAALLAAMKNVDYDIAVDQSTKLDATTEPERCTAGTIIEGVPFRCELEPHGPLKSHVVHPDDSTLYRW